MLSFCPQLPLQTNQIHLERSEVHGSPGNAGDASLEGLLSSIVSILGIVLPHIQKHRSDPSLARMHRHGHTCRSAPAASRNGKAFQIPQSTNSRQGAAASAHGFVERELPAGGAPGTSEAGAASLSSSAGSVFINQRATEVVRKMISEVFNGDFTTNGGPENCSMRSCCCQSCGIDNWSSWIRQRTGGSNNNADGDGIQFFDCQLRLGHYSESRQGCESSDKSWTRVTARTNPKRVGCRVPRSILNAKPNVEQVEVQLRRQLANLTGDDLVQNAARVVREQSDQFNRFNTYSNDTSGDRDDRRDVRASQVPSCLFESYTQSMKRSPILQ